MKARRYLAIAGFVAISVMLLGGCTFIFGPWSGWEGYFEDISIEVSWGGSVDDVDLYVTYPLGNPIDGAGEPVYSTILKSYDTNVAGGDTGFFPEDVTGREGVSGAPGWLKESTYGVGPAVELVEESSWGGPEVVVVRELPFSTTGISFDTDPNADNGLPYGSTYAWVGVMEVYLYAQDGQLAYPSGGGANPVVTFRDSNDDIISEIMTPTYADLEGASVARINLFVENNGGSQYNFYQILPQVQRYTDENQFRSITGGDEAPAAINIRGRER